MTVKTDKASSIWFILSVLRQHQDCVSEIPKYAGDLYDDLESITNGVGTIDNLVIKEIPKLKHCVKIVQIRSFIWSVFSPNTKKYGPKNLRIWALFTQLKVSVTNPYKEQIRLYLTGQINSNGCWILNFTKCQQLNLAIKGTLMQI